MRTVVAAVILCLASLNCRADGIDDWLDEYFAATASVRRQAFAAVLAQHPDWRPHLEARERFGAADEAMYRYLFRYHLEHGTARMTWENGRWTRSIMVCHCGQEGSVPTEQFGKLFAARSQALLAEQALWTEAFRKAADPAIRAAGSREATNERIASLRDRFERLLERTPTAPADPPFMMAPAPH